jgi:tetratricopeptide (TPR) repeat protein
MAFPMRIVEITLLAGASLAIITSTNTPALCETAEEDYQEGTRLLNQQQPGLALTALTKAIRLNPNYASAYYRRGAAYAIANRNQEAMDDLDKAINLDPKLVSAYCQRGSLYCQAGKYQDAMKDFNKAIRLDTKYAPTYCGRGMVFSKLEHYHKAIEDYTIAINLAGEKALPAYDGRAYAYHMLGRDSLAENDKQKAEKIRLGK